MKRSLKHVGTGAETGRSRLRRAGSVLVATASLVGIAACSSGQEPIANTSTTSKPAEREALDKDQFLAEANAVCAAMNSRHHISLTRYPNGPETIDEIVLVLAKTVDVVEDALEDLREIPPPAVDDQHVTGMYTKLDRLIALTQDMAAAAYRKDVAAVEDLERRSDELSLQLSAEFDAYGLVACAE